MQTFLPYSNFEMSARVLDYRRLGKQRVEALTILRILTGQTKSKAWRNHPAVLMWRGYEEALKLYLGAIIIEWVRRGFKNSIAIPVPCNSVIEYPRWLGVPAFHESHKSNLLRKDPEFYGKYGWEVSSDQPYWWPTKEMEQCQ